MNPVTEPVKITSLELENVKRIRACAITPTQNGLTVIGGRNNQGKTSVLDAIAWALGGDRHRPSRAVREGSAIPPRLCVKLVQEIFQRYADGEIVRTIVEDFNKRGLKTKSGKSFSPNSFNRILKNRKYIGEYQYQDVIIPGGVPAIVSEDIFYQVQARLEKNKHAPATAKADVDYLLTTKLFCGHCERMMVGESGTSHTGDKHYYYKCGGAKEGLQEEICQEGLH